mmetsp:Transcript_3991/g.16275  ORF Transcript_3991/g.16275 Transcript_3991/m.16275 type:complete len:244 (-) Transcript_3991:212-943(-)
MRTLGAVAVVAVLAKRLLLRVLLVNLRVVLAGARGGLHHGRGARHASHAPVLVPGPGVLRHAAGIPEQVAEPVLVLAVGGAAVGTRRGPRRGEPRALRAAPAPHDQRGVEVMHQDDALVAVEEPVAPALEPVVLCGVRVVAVQELDVANLELLVRLSHRLAVLLLLPVVTVLTEEPDGLAVEQEDRAGRWPHGRRLAQREAVRSVVEQHVAHFGVLEPPGPRLVEHLDHVRARATVGALSLGH